MVLRTAENNFLMRANGGWDVVVGVEAFLFMQQKIFSHQTKRVHADPLIGILWTCERRNASISRYKLVGYLFPAAAEPLVFVLDERLCRSNSPKASIPNIAWLAY